MVMCRPSAAARRMGRIPSFLQIPGAVIEDHLADQRIFERPHEGAHRTVRLFREGGSGHFPVPVMGGHDDILRPPLVAVHRHDAGNVVRRRDHMDLVRGIELVHLDHFNEEFREFEITLQRERPRQFRVREQPGVHHVLDRPHPVTAVGQEQQTEQQSAQRIPDLQRQGVNNPVKNAEQKVFRVDPEFTFRLFLFCHLSSRRLLISRLIRIY